MPGQIVHLEIPADDTAGEKGFWESLFGWNFEEFPGPFEYHMTRISDRPAGYNEHGPGKHGMRVYFDVEDINAGAARVRELGGEANDPTSVPQTGWLSTCKDPHGNEFGLWRSDPTASAKSGS